MITTAHKFAFLHQHDVRVAAARRNRWRRRWGLSQQNETATCLHAQNPRCNYYSCQCVCVYVPARAQNYSSSLLRRLEFSARDARAFKHHDYGEIPSTHARATHVHYRQHAVGDRTKHPSLTHVLQLLPKGVPIQRRHTHALSFSFTQTEHTAFAATEFRNWVDKPSLARATRSRCCAVVYHAQHHSISHSTHEKRRTTRIYVLASLRMCGMVNGLAAYMCA